MLRNALFLCCQRISFRSLPCINSRRWLVLRLSPHARRAVREGCALQIPDEQTLSPSANEYKTVCVCALCCAALCSLFFYFASANRDFECIKTMFYVFQFRARPRRLFLLISRRARVTLKTRSSANSSQTSCWVPKLVAPPSASPVWLFVASKLARAICSRLFYGTTFGILKNYYAREAKPFALWDIKLQRARLIFDSNALNENEGVYQSSLQSGETL